MRYRNRHRLKDKEVQKYLDEIRSKLGDVPFEPNEPIDIATISWGKVLLSGDKPVVAFFEKGIFPTIEGLLSMGAVKAYVTVDMGAVKFIYNGADVMAPGVVDADEGIVEGQFVWIKDESHGKPLAIGTALTDGRSMVESDEGKVVKTLHHIGDGIFS